MDANKSIYGIDSDYMHIGPKVNIQRTQITKKEEQDKDGKKKKKQQKGNTKDEGQHDAHVIDIRC